MKRIVSLLLCAAGFVLLSGCGGSGGGKSPGDVIKKYASALANGDTQPALNCIAPEKRKGAEPLIQMGASIASAFAKAEGGLDSVSILNESVQGDRARVGYQTKTKKGRERRDAAQAEKINGTWYVAP